MKQDHHPIAKRIRNEVMKEKKIATEIYHSEVMKNHKEKLIQERKLEIEQLQKRIRYLEMELEGMGIWNHGR